MFCPKCGEVMIVNDGEVTCVSGDMQLSASMRDGLTEVFVDRRRRGRHRTLNSGGQWFCPGCGAPMKIDGEHGQCETCGECLDEFVHALVELHPHRG